MNAAGAILKSSRLRSLAKLGLVAALLYFLAKRGFLSVEATGRALRQWQYVPPAWGLMLVSTVVSIFRWHLLMRAQGIDLPVRRTYQFGFIGNFFNIALPGAVSGDVVKAIYVGREVAGKRARALSSILFDRVAGVSSLMLVSTGAMIFSLDAPWAGRLLRAIQVIVTAGGASIVCFYAYLFLVREHWDPLLKAFRALEARSEKLGSLTRIYEGIRTYHEKRSIVLAALGISLVIHCMVIAACVLFARAIGETNLPERAVFILVPLGLFVTAVPIAPAGVGTGHAAFLALFHLLGSSRGADIFNLFVLFNLGLGAVGGLVYLRFKGEVPFPGPESGDWDGPRKKAGAPAA